MKQLSNVEELSQTGLPNKITQKELEAAAQTPRGKILEYAKITLYLLVSTFLLSFAAYSLVAPNQFTLGGIAGIAIILQKKFAIPQSLTALCFNIPLVVTSYFFVKRRFAIMTTIHILLQSFWLRLLETTFQDKIQIAFDGNGNRIFAAIGAGLCLGVAIALVFKIGGSSGGADIIAVIIQKKIAAQKIAWVMFCVNCAVILAYFFIFYDTAESLAVNLLPIMMSAFEQYVESKTHSSVAEGFQSAVEFRIITKKPDEMSQALMRELSRGVTAIPATGMYTKEPSSMILCVVSRRQVPALKRVMKDVDPDSFAVMANVSQVLGLGFYTQDI